MKKTSTARLPRALAACVLSAALAALPCGAAVAADAAAGVQLHQLQAARDADGIVLDVHLSLVLPEVVQDALRRGVPVFFEAEAEVLRRRYWLTQRQARSRIYMRLAYQALTRHWRLAVAPHPLGDVQPAAGLAQSFDTLHEALAAAGHIARWQVASEAQLAGSGRQALRFTFRLDTSRLPQAMQIGAMGPGASGWILELKREISLGRAPKPETPPATAPLPPAQP